MRHLLAMIAVDAEQYVERPAPGAAPTAFRIYAAGENMSDDGPVYFTRESARLLMAEQAARARTYSIDFDHLSLMTDRPAESGRAAGWHRIEVRTDAAGEPELWATSAEWCVDVKAGLEEKPPRWKYFSPAFKTRVRDGKDTGEIVSYLNLAVCINPKTHELPALAAVTTSTTKAAAATKGVGPMDPEKLKAILASMLAELGDGEKKDALSAAYKAAFPETDGKEPDGDEKKKNAVEEESPKKDDDASKKAATEEKAPEKDDDAEKKAAAKRDADFKLAARVQELERDALNNLIAQRADIAGPVKEWLQAQTIDVARSYLAKAPKAAAPLNGRATQGRHEDAGGVLLEGKDREEMDRMMGIHANAVRMPERQDDGTFVVHTVKPSALRAEMAKGKV